jgi:hypothetical protein
MLSVQSVGTSRCLPKGVCGGDERPRYFASKRAEATWRRCSSRVERARAAHPGELGVSRVFSSLHADR